MLPTVISCSSRALFAMVVPGQNRRFYRRNPRIAHWDPASPASFPASFAERTARAQCALTTEIQHSRRILHMAQRLLRASPDQRV